MDRNDYEKGDAQNDIEKIVMSTYWSSGEDVFKKYEENIETFIRAYFKGKFRIVSGNITENKYLNFDYFVNDVHVASIKGKFEKGCRVSVFNPDKWCEESISNHWYWCTEWYWKEKESELWNWFGKTRAERFEDDYYYLNYWTSFYGGIEGEDFIIDEFGHEIQITGCMQLREDSFDDLENV